MNIFLGKNHYYFNVPACLFIVQILKKFLQRIHSYEDAPFLGPKWYICPPPKIFLWKIINIILIYLLAPFIGQNFNFFFKKNPADPELWDAKFLGPKQPISPNETIFQKAC